MLSACEGIEVAAEAATGAAAIRTAAELRVDVVLLAAGIAGEDPAGLIRELRQKAPRAKAILLDGTGDERRTLAALRAGAYGCLTSELTEQSLAEAIRLVHQGRRHLSPALLDGLLQRLPDLARAQARQEHGLSEEELRVLELLAQGATNREISAALYCSERTAKRRIEAIIAKMDARNRTHAVATAIRRGLI